MTLVVPNDNDDEVDAVAGCLVEWERKLNEGGNRNCLVASDMAERSLSVLNSPANIAADGDGRSRVSVGRAKGEMYRQLRRRLVVQRMLCSIRRRGHWYHWVKVTVESSLLQERYVG